MRRRVGQVALALVLGLGLLHHPRDAARAQDVVWKTDGGKLRGKIVREDKSGVTIETPGGTYTVPRGEIARLEKGADVFKEHESRRAKLRQDDLHGWFELGRWCQNQELYPQSIDCFTEVLRIEPDHEEARFELGYRRHDGRWVTEAVYFEAKGFKRWVDRWVTAEEYEKLEQGLVQKDGRWVKADEAEQEPQVASRPEARPQPKPAPGKAEPQRPRQGFPWGAGGAAPLGGQVGQPPLTPEQRAAQLDKLKAAGGWSFAVSSKYYDLYSNGPADEVKALGRTMDLVCDEFKEVFRFEQEITRPFPIHLYANQQEFMSRTGHGQGTGGFYDGSKIVGFHGNLGSLTTQSVLFHEGTHQFQGLVLGRNMWRAKIWLIEGLAVFFEATEVQGKRVSTGAIPRDRLAHVKRAISSGSYVRLSELIRMEQAQFGALHYAHAWSLIYFFVHGAGGGKKRFVEYWERTKTGEDGVKLFEELFDRPIDEIEAAWKQYVLQLG